jgi:hypothetical protein
VRKSTSALRLKPSLMKEARKVAKAEGVAVNQLINVAVAEKVTERQTRFLVTFMLHSGVFVGRQYAAFAGITHGQKVHDFVVKLVARKFVTPIELGSTGRTRIFHVRHKPLYAAVGEPDNRNRRRVTIDRAIERRWSSTACSRTDP